MNGWRSQSISMGFPQYMLTERSVEKMKYAPLRLSPICGLHIEIYPCDS
jgi:hypothetical protein